MKGKRREFEILSTLHKLRGLANCVCSFKVLSLPSFVWRQLVGEKVTWSRDFMTIDLAQVRVYSATQMFLVRSHNTPPQCCVMTLKTAVLSRLLCVQNCLVACVWL